MAGQHAIGIAVWLMDIAGNQMSFSAAPDRANQHFCRAKYRTLHNARAQIIQIVQPRAHNALVNITPANIRVRKSLRCFLDAAQRIAAQRFNYIMMVNTVLWTSQLDTVRVGIDAAGRQYRQHK